MIFSFLKFFDKVASRIIWFFSDKKGIHESVKVSVEKLFEKLFFVNVAVVSMYVGSRKKLIKFIITY